ncbi:LTA synthase family protein [Bifidobacterium callimiconis]|uniref:Arylsulfatase n=1 Tax=Bifidobacterium callimiconis TaxID=2306973 RepID=A0A430FBV5_9BIFI|nr:alkaline phosphatase family protein [Bifidobacterium callimiconis]RSX50310.1 arylsulfatase [Bifidobacterium callimiconis]
MTEVREPAEMEETTGESAADGVIDSADVNIADFDLRTRHMKPFGWRFYLISFLMVDVVAVGLLQWSVWTVEPLRGFGGFISKMWTSNDYQFLLNMLILAVAYLILVVLINRFWIASAVFLSIVGFCAVADRFKVMVRYETIKPSDLSFLKSDAGSMVGFIPTGSSRVFMDAAIFFLAMVVICYSLHQRDGRRKFIDLHSRVKNTAARLLFIVCPGLFLGLFTAGLATTGSWSYNFAQALGDSPKLWDSVTDAQANGTLIGFQRFVNPKVMDEPANYSEKTMAKIAKRYSQAADEINQTRESNLEDSTVIMVLSESFSDPTRVPGLALNKDPMPNIREIKTQTTSGLMLSAGYGGGTANMEFMALTGLSMANFDASLSSPYQQLIPKLSWTPTFNQLWNDGKDSQAFHPYESSMYSRSSNYKKFKFKHFWTLNEPDVIAHQSKIDSSPYVQDSDAYQSLLEKIDTSKSQFLSVLTMQNHMSYDNWYTNNEFQATSTTDEPLGLDETTQIQTYAKGVEYTDQATKAFLDQLDNIDKPITVIFYGDHLPGAYASASDNTDNSVALHETDYFIWSNKASGSHGTKLPDSTTAFTSPNYFMAQTAEHMNAKVSPYLAFLTRLHDKVPALEPPVVNKIQSWSRIPDGQALYLDKEGNRIDITQADKATQQLLEDYKLIQYDITAGKGYLKDLDFMELPKTEALEEAEEAAKLPMGTKNAGEVPMVNGKLAAAAASQQEGQGAQSAAQ